MAKLQSVVGRVGILIFWVQLAYGQTGHIVAADPQNVIRPLSLSTDQNVSASGYIASLLVNIGARWNSPMQGATAHPVVRFVLSREGRITNVQLERSSGVYSIDEEALHAVERASPFLPFPPYIADPSIVGHLTFTPRRASSAAEGSAAAYLNARGSQLLAGNPDHRDPLAAVHSFEQAAEMGDARAMANLGFLYETGQGVPVDEKLAARWYVRAAELGSEIAGLHAARMYESGRGVSQDKAQALRWYRELSSSSKTDIAREARDAVDRLSR